MENGRLAGQDERARLVSREFAIADIPRSARTEAPRPGSRTAPARRPPPASDRPHRRCRPTCHAQAPSPARTNSRSPSSSAPTSCSPARRGPVANPDDSARLDPTPDWDGDRRRGAAPPSPTLSPARAPRRPGVARRGLASPVLTPLSRFDPFRPLETAQNQVPHNQCYEDAPEKCRRRRGALLPGRGRSRIARIRSQGPVLHRPPPARRPRAPPRQRPPDLIGTGPTRFLASTLWSS